MRRLLSLFTVVASLGLATLAAPAVAGVYRIDFYNGVFDGSVPSQWDWDGDGVVDYSGTFVSAGGPGSSPITAFAVTIDGVTYDGLASLWPASYYTPDGGGPIPIPYVYGFVFDEPIDSTTVTVLQMSPMGIGGVSGANYYAGWGLSPCNTSACGGGLYRGMLTITALEVPEPGTLALLGLGLAGLARLRRRKH